MKTVRKKAAQITGQRRFFSGGRDSEFPDYDEDGGWDYMPNLESGNHPYLLQPGEEIDDSSISASQRGVMFGAADSEGGDDWHQHLPPIIEQPQESPRKSVLRPIRKAVSRLTGAQGFFSGKQDEESASGSGNDSWGKGDGRGGQALPPEARTRLGYQQALNRLDTALQSFWYPDGSDSSSSGHHVGGCCGCCGSCCRGYLGPLRATGAGESERERVKEIVPWSAVAVMGVAVTLNAAMRGWDVWRHYEKDDTDPHAYNYSDLFSGLALTFAASTYFVCWLIGLRIACAGAPRRSGESEPCSFMRGPECCATKVPLPHWHRMLAAVPVVGVSVLVAYAPWLMALTTALTIVPQYFINISYCLSHQMVTGTDLASGITAALVIILTPAHIIVSVSLRNDARLANRRRGLYDRYPESERLQRFSQASSVVDGGSGLNIMDTPGSVRDRKRSISQLYISRLWDVLVVIAAPMVLDLTQCLPLLGTHLFMEYMQSGDLFVGLLAAFVVPRILLLGLSFVRRRISFNKQTGRLELSGVDRVSLLAHICGMSASDGSEMSSNDGSSGGGTGQGHMPAEEANQLISQAERAANNPLGPIVTCLRNTMAAILMMVFPLTPSLFLILDNLAKVTAATVPRSKSSSFSSDSSGAGSLSVLSTPLTGPQSVDRGTGEFIYEDDEDNAKDSSCCSSITSCSCLDDFLIHCCNCNPVCDRRYITNDEVRLQRNRSSDVLHVSVGPDDRSNTLVYSLHLILAYGSQATLLFCKGGALWPLIHGEGFLGGAKGAKEFLAGGGGVLDDEAVVDERATLVIMVLGELIIAIGLAVALRCCLGTAMWRRVRVIFANRASLWLGAASRDRRTGTFVVASASPTNFPGRQQHQQQRTVVGGGGGGAGGGGGGGGGGRGRSKKGNTKVPTAIARPIHALSGPQEVTVFPTTQF